jgi:hypothetical protein
MSLDALGGNKARTRTSEFLGGRDAMRRLEPDVNADEQPPDSGGPELPSFGRDPVDAPDSRVARRLGA